MLQLFEGLCLYLSYPFTGNTHHFTDFLKGEGPVIAGHPGAVTECLVFQPPLARPVFTGFRDEKTRLFASVKVRCQYSTPFV